MKCLVLYSSLGGNTQQVAETITTTLKNGTQDVELVKIDQETNIDLYQFELVFLGSPSIMWQPTKATLNFAKRIMQQYQITPSCPIRPGKYAVCFCTYGGPHTGISEATPVIKWMNAFFGHLGFQVLAEWFTIGAFKNEEDSNTMGRLGDIRGRPNQADLLEIEEKTKGILRMLQLCASP
jgi:flavodoxin